MTNWPALQRFLDTDPRDVGCEEALAVLHVYVELVLADGGAEDAGDLARRRYPGVAAHLLACGPCDEDFQGLLLAAGEAGR
ncbi:MAG: hypothetical protein ACR2JU_02955 [Nocardioidaceae bacterium]